MPAPKNKRGAVQKSAATLVAVWIPNEILQLLDAAVAAEDSDRSKTIRKALRRHLNRLSA